MKSSCPLIIKQVNMSEKKQATHQTTLSLKQHSTHTSSLFPKKEKLPFH